MMILSRLKIIWPDMVHSSLPYMRKMEDVWNFEGLSMDTLELIYNTDTNSSIQDYLNN